METNETIYETLKFYKDKNISIHLNLTFGKWLNGKIINLPNSKDRVIIQEEKLGEMLVFFDRLSLLNPIEPREVKE